MTDAVGQIRALIEERIAAIACKDAACATATLTDDIVAFELAPPLALPRGAAKDEGALAGWLNSFEDIAVEVRDLTIEADKDVGFAHSLHHLNGTRADGRHVSLWMRSTLCVRREAQGWRIAHAHTSVPMLMDGSFRAAVGLHP